MDLSNDFVEAVNGKRVGTVWIPLKIMGYPQLLEFFITLRRQVQSFPTSKH